MDLLNCGISGFWHPEERTHERRQFLQFSEMSKNQVLEVVGNGYWLVPHSMILKMIPDLFIWIEFW